MKRTLKTHVGTRTELAKRLQLSRPTLRRYLAAEGAPKFEDGRGFDVAAAARFVAEHARCEGTAAKTSPDIAKLKVRELSAKCRRLEFHLERDRGQWVKRELVATKFAEIAHAIRPLLNAKLVNEWPSAVAGLDVAQAQIYGRRLYDQIVLEFERMATVWDGV